MIITVEEIQESLGKIWPHLSQIWCFDHEYICPTVDEMTLFVNENWVDINTIKAKNPDCDDFALQLHAKIKLNVNWSFGEAFACKIDGWSVLHNLNICICQTDVLLIDNKKKSISKASAINDNVLWVRI